MARVFVSYAARTPAVAGRFAVGWSRTATRCSWIGIVDDGIGVGEEWEQRLHERLRWADAVVCLVTSAYRGVDVVFAEVAIALSRGSRVLPVRAEPGVRHPLLTAAAAGRLDDRMRVARAQLAEALRRVDAAGGSGWPDDRSPFPGLRPFDTDLHRVFFGRSREVEQLAALLRSPAERADAGGAVGGGAVGVRQVVAGAGRVAAGDGRRARLVDGAADAARGRAGGGVGPGADRGAARSRAWAGRLAEVRRPAGSRAGWRRAGRRAVAGRRRDRAGRGC